MDEKEKINNDLNNLSAKEKENIKNYIEHMNQFPIKISQIDNVYKKGPYYVVEAKDERGSFVGAEFTEEDFLKIISKTNDDEKGFYEELSVIDNYDTYEEDRIDDSHKNEALEVLTREDLMNKIINSMPPEELQYVQLPDLKKKMEKMKIEELEEVLEYYEKEYPELEKEQKEKSR